MTSLRTPVRAAACALATTALSTTLALAPAQAGRCVGADHIPANARSAAQARYATLCLLNRVRSHHGLRHLRSNGSLRKAANGFSWRMVREGFFGHTAPDGSGLLQRVQATRYLHRHPRASLAENIGYGDGRLGTPRAIVRAWMNSAGHRQNILTAAYRDVGLGIVPGEPGSPGAGATYTTDFGVRHR
jgi:uncharacterized protein YkwD